MLLTAIVTSHAAYADDAAIHPRFRIPIARAYAGEIRVSYSDGLLLIGEYRRATAYDANTGKRLWARDEIHFPALAGSTLYASRMTLGQRAGHEFRPLIALDPRTGATRWERGDDVGGPIAVDDNGIVAGGIDSLQAFTLDGTRQWSVPSDGNFVHLTLLGDTIVAESSRSGAIIHGALEAFDRATGRRRGPPNRYDRRPGSELSYFETLFDIRAGHAYGANDFGNDYDTICTGRDIYDVDLATMQWTRTTYSLAVRSPANVPCRGAREARPRTTVANGIVALGSGTITAFYRVGETTPIVPIMDDATYVGGPFAGYYYLNRPHGLEAFRFTFPGTQSLRFANVRAAHVAVAGIADRLYVATNTSIEAYDVAHLDGPPLRRYAAWCPVMIAVGRAATNDLLMCRDDANFGASAVLALPR